MDREFATRFSSNRNGSAIMHVVEDASCKLAVHLVVPACFTYCARRFAIYGEVAETPQFNRMVTLNHDHFIRQFIGIVDGSWEMFA